MPIKDELKTNKRHAVPQNIMDVEFKLIGDLTMRQFFYILIFAAIAYGAYISNLVAPIKWPTILGSILLGLGFAFVPYEDRGIDEWIVNFFNAVYRENQSIWKKRARPPTPFLHENISLVKQELITLAPTSSRRKLEQYLRGDYSARPDPLDIKEEEYVKKISDAYAKVSAPAPVKAPPAKQKAPVQQPKPRLSKILLPKTKKKIKQKSVPPPSITKEAYIPVTPMTPDRHSGRKFTNLLTDQGEIVLPIKGEKVIKLTDEQKSAEEKAEQLKAFVAQIDQNIPLTKRATPTPPSTTKSSSQQVGKEVEKLVGKLKEENTKLSGEIENLKQDIKKAELNNLQQEKIKEVEKLQRQKEKSSKTIAELQEQVKGLDVPQKLTVVQPKKAESTPQFQKPEESPPTVSVPNAVAGTVKKPNSTGIPGVLVVIKNANNDPVRAIKTNAVGQFTISNPLPNGQYKVEVDLSSSSGFSFDIIKVETKGEIIPPMEFVGKSIQ